MDRNSYILVKNYFTKEEGNMITKWADQMNTMKESKGDWMIYYEQNADNKKEKSRIENFSKFNPHIENFVNVRIKTFMEETIGKKLAFFKDKMNWKRPGGKGFLAHQDHPAWDDFPPSIYYSAAFFGDNCTIGNGCLQFVDNFSIKKIIDYDKEGTGKLIDEDKFEWKHVETTPRDLVIFNSFIPHRSESNMTENSRRIFYFTFNDKEEGDFFKAYLKEKRDKFPPPNERIEGKEYKTEGQKYNLANPIV
tara:strand:+ start:369 stop:1118 length:750 start_codon:yes stop_codon:yes gene_type:complete